MNVVEDGDLRGGRKIFQLICKCLAISVLSFPNDLHLLDQVLTKKTSSRVFKPASFLALLDNLETVKIKNYLL